MAKYVKISKAKNLRFRLISVLYLLFISLSIIQIPIEWLRINPYYVGYMKEITSKDALAPELLEARIVVTKVDSSFLVFCGFNEETQFLKEPAGYAATDQYFLRKENGQIIFNALVSLRDYYFAKNVSDVKRKEFERLFKSDLENGLKDGKVNIWNEWKFKHVPATVVRTLLAEIKLRLNLLNGAIELDEKATKAQNAVKLAFNVESLQLGDTAKFIVADKNQTEVIITNGKNISNEFSWTGNELNFVPKSAGTYSLVFNTQGIEEKIVIQIQPATFLTDNKESVQFVYEGKETKLRYQNIENIGKLRCNCAGDDFISYKSGEVSITPEKYGWCTIELLSKNGGSLLADSIYVQKLPSPVILAKNVSANKISKSRLLQQKSLKLTANHHNMGNVIYDISSIKATFIGIDGDMRTFEGANISLTAEQLERIKYIQINEVTVETRVRNFTVTEPLIIEII